MKSMQLLLYKAEEGTLEVRARDYNPNWMTAVAVLDDDCYLGAENSYNLFTVKKNSDAAADEERNRLMVGARATATYTNTCISYCSTLRLGQIDWDCNPVHTSTVAR